MQCMQGQLTFIWGCPRLLRCLLPLSLRALVRSVPTSASSSPPLPLPAPLSRPLPLLPVLDVTKSHECAHTQLKRHQAFARWPHQLSCFRCQPQYQSLTCCCLFHLSSDLSKGAGSILLAYRPKRTSHPAACMSMTQQNFHSNLMAQ